MSSIFTLVGYEYKKLILRRSTWIVISLTILITLFSCFGDVLGTVYVEGEPVGSHYEQMIIDRDYARKLTGREIDEALISEMQEAYSLVPEGTLYTASEEYQTYARPYYPIYNLVRKVTREFLNADGSELNELELDGSRYYELRKEAIQKKLEKGFLTDIEVKEHLERIEQVKTPFVFEYADGYSSIIRRMYTIGILLTMALATCIAPVFANEIANKTDQLILTSRWGKNKVILAKLFTGMTFGFIMTIVVLLVLVFPTLCIYGFDGWKAPLQLWDVMTTYPVTALEAVLILCGLAVASSMMITGLSLYLSAKLKNAAAVVTSISFLTILIMYISIPDQYRFLSQLVRGLPNNIMDISMAFTDYFVLIFGKCIPLYQTVPVIYGFVIVLLLVFGYRSFKNHQIG